MAIALTTFNATAASVSPAGPITISWTVYQAGSNVTHSVTNHTPANNPTSTNILRTTSEKSKSFLFKNASFIALLENSFNTTFPKGSQLVYGDGPAGASIYLVDKTGTNIVFDISPVVSVTSSNGVQSGASSSTEKITSTKTTFTGSGSGPGTSYQTFTYNDTALATANGQKSQFSFSGVSSSSGSVNYTETFTPPSSITVKGTERQSFVVTGSGAGTINGTASVIGGTVNGSASGPYQIAE